MGSKRSMHTDEKFYRKFCRKARRERDRLRDLSIKRRIILKLCVKKQVIRVCTGLYWFRKQSNRGLSWTR